MDNIKTAGRGKVSVQLGKDAHRANSIFREEIWVMQVRLEASASVSTQKSQPTNSSSKATVWILPGLHPPLPNHVPLE